jgi:hypothetical protein
MKAVSGDNGGSDSGDSVDCDSGDSGGADYDSGESTPLPLLDRNHENW